MLPRRCSLPPPVPPHPCARSPSSNSANLADETLNKDADVVEASLALLAALAEDADGSPRKAVVKKIVAAGAVDPAVMALFSFPDHAGVQAAGSKVLALIVGPEAVASMVETLRKNLAALKLVDDPTAKVSLFYLPFAVTFIEFC